MRDLTLGPVYLNVSNLEELISFYTKRLGFKVHEQTGNTAILGAGREPLIVLKETPDRRRVRGSTGLYHFAILTPSRFELAKVLRELIIQKTPVQGFSDHLVSEAIYLPDPDGNGIEIYRDRPRSEWPRLNGELGMGTEPLDLESLIGELDGYEEAWTGMHRDTTMGHMHLHVADIPQAETFYRMMLDMDVVMYYPPSAAFLSYEGYHHHLGINTWAGKGAPPPPPDALGLDKFTLRLRQTSLEGVLEKLRSANIPVSEENGGYIVEDPSRNRILLTMLDESHDVESLSAAEQTT